MSDHDLISERPAASHAATLGQRRRLPRRVVIAAALAGVALIGAGAGTPAGHRMLMQVPVVGPSLAAAAPFDDGLGWRGGFFNGMIEAVVEDHADRAVRHLSIEIDATTEQQDKLRAIVRDAVKDLLPVREKMMAARAQARDLLTQDAVDRAAIEKLRADLIAAHDAASKRLVQAVADAADVLTPEQRRRIADMAAAYHDHWRPWGGHGPWGHWGGWQH